MSDVRFEKLPSKILYRKIWKTFVVAEATSIFRISIHDPRHFEYCMNIVALYRSRRARRRTCGVLSARTRRSETHILLVPSLVRPRACIVKISRDEEKLLCQKKQRQPLVVGTTWMNSNLILKRSLSRVFDVPSPPPKLLRNFGA